MPHISDIQEKLQQHGQGHLLRFYDELAEHQQINLLEQIAKIDFHQLDRLIESHVKQHPPVQISEGIRPPETEPRRPADQDTQARHAEARAHGQKLLREGKVAAFVVAGGQGTRLGYEGPKGCLEVTPVVKKSLFQVFAEQILAATRRYGKPIPWYVMTSPINDVATRAFFRHHGYFGLAEEDVFFFTQGTMPSISTEGKLLLAAKDQLAVNPDGHGGSLLALRRSGALDDMARRGVEQISYFQVDNPLVHCIDPLFVGLHAQAKAGMSAKALPKRDPMEKLGNFCVSDGDVHVIEYSDMPDELARQTTDDGRLRFRAGSIAIHVIAREFVEHLTEGDQCKLPFHRADKKVPHLDQTGQLVQPEEPNAVKLEMFVFDAMPLSDHVVILETDRDEEFSPVKNKEGKDSLATCLHDQVRRAAEWLEEAGLSVPRDADGIVAAAIEISPLFADTAGALAEKLDRDVTVEPGQNLYIE